MGCLIQLGRFMGMSIHMSMDLWVMVARTVYGGST